MKLLFVLDGAVVGDVIVDLQETVTSVRSRSQMYP